MMKPLQALKTELLDEAGKGSPDKSMLARAPVRNPLGGYGEILEDLIEEDKRSVAALALLRYSSTERPPTCWVICPRKPAGSG